MERARGLGLVGRGGSGPWCKNPAADADGDAGGEAKLGVDADAVARESVPFP